MEAVWRIEVEDFPAFIVVDDKGNDFFAEVSKPMAFTIEKRPGLHRDRATRGDMTEQHRSNGIRRPARGQPALRRRLPPQGFDGIAQAGVAIVTCMDSRIDPLGISGSSPATPRSSATRAAASPSAALEALVLGTHLLNVDRILVVPHTRCAMASSTENELRHADHRAVRGSTRRGMSFGVIDDQEQKLREDLAKVRAHPLIPDSDARRRLHLRRRHRPAPAHRLKAPETAAPHDAGPALPCGRMPFDHLVLTRFSAVRRGQVEPMPPEWLHLSARLLLRRLPPEPHPAGRAAPRSAGSSSSTTAAPTTSASRSRTSLTAPSSRCGVTRTSTASPSPRPSSGMPLRRVRRTSSRRAWTATTRSPVTSSPVQAQLERPARDALGPRRGRPSLRQLHAGCRSTIRSGLPSRPAPRPFPLPHRAPHARCSTPHGAHDEAQPRPPHRAGARGACRADVAACAARR